MSDFDVDCPRTPDGDTITVDDSKRISVDDKPLPPPKKRPIVLSNSRPTSATRARSSAGIEVARGTTPRATTTKMFSPCSQLGKAAQLRRGQSSMNNKGRGLEPEEYIAPKAPPQPPRRTPSVADVPRPSTSMVGTHNRAGNNPFDDRSVTYDRDNRGRTYSGTMWKEEIVNEGGNKVENIDKYYGLDLHEKHNIYGPSTTVVVDVEQGANNHATTDALNTSIYHHAASIHSAGHVKVTDTTTMKDDYTFSDVDLSGTRAADSSSIQQRDNVGGGSLRDILLEWCINNLSSSSSTIDPFTHHRYGVTKKDGWWDRQSPIRKMGVGLIWMILMCTIFGVTVSQLKSNNSVPSEKEESNTLRAFVDTSGLNMSDIYLAPPAPELEPTTFLTGMPTEESTLPQPTMMPVTESPIAQNYLVHLKTSGMTVTRRTFPPVTSKPTTSPTVKVSEGEQGSSDSPTVKIDSVHAASASEILNDDMDGDKNTSRIGADWLCVDITSGLYKNHLGNPFNCTWLHNDKDGYTDRKDKNCGGRVIKNKHWGGTMVYPTSELGGICRATCRLYNGCDSSDAGTVPTSTTGTTPGMTAMTNQVVSKKHFSPCQDSQSEFLNHLKNRKTCDWLYNDKPGMTDRKNKECGMDGHPVTDLGLACPSTCSVYNKGECIGSEVAEIPPNDAEEQDEDEEENSKLAALLKEMEVTEEEVVELTDARKKVTAPSSASMKKESEKRIYNTSTLPICNDAKGEYLSHQSKLKDCNWLFNKKDGKTDRKDMNCGTPKYQLTELGEMCRKTCSVYDNNGCSVDEEIKKDAGQVTRSYSSKLYSFSLSSPEK